jgi:hypothetical protein
MSATSGKCQEQGVPLFCSPPYTAVCLISGRCREKPGVSQPSHPRCTRTGLRLSSRVTVKEPYVDGWKMTWRGSGSGVGVVTGGEGQALFPG